MKYLLFTALLFAVTGLKAQQTNFSGRWARNTDQCDPGDLSMNSIPVEVSVKQTARQFEITRISKNYKGDTATYSEILKLDGTPASTLIKSNLNKKASVSWLAYNKTLTETADYIDDSGNSIQKGKELWAVSEDGKTLTVQSTLTLNGQDHVLAEVYNKK